MFFFTGPCTIAYKNPELKSKHTTVRTHNTAYSQGC